ncbi:MAG: DUF3224 domain-containing protein [Chloroflexota bacterium]
MRHASGSFAVSGMQEESYEELAGGAKLTRASGDQAYTGDIDGNGKVQWLMSYRGDGTAHFVGIWHLTVSIDEHDGSFVLESVGEFDGKASSGTLSIVDGLGAGDLQSIRGSGSFRAPGGADATYELDYDVS